jgi:hypothetical protein
MINFMLSLKEMTIDISKVVSRMLANEQLVVKENLFFQSIIAKYAHDPWFMNLNNVFQLILRVVYSVIMMQCWYQMW